MKGDKGKQLSIAQNMMVANFETEFSGTLLGFDDFVSTWIQ